MIKGLINGLLSTVLVLGVFPLISCPSDYAVAAPLVQKTAPTMPNEWQALVTAAQKEGKVTLYGHIGSEAKKVLLKELKSKFGITAEVVSGRGGEIANKIIAEQNSGLYIADVIFASTTNIINYLLPQGKVDRMDSVLILPEILDPKVWWEGKLPWVDKEKRYHLAFFASPRVDVMVNTSMVKPGEIESYKDLLAPKWKGMIVINDPTITGAGISWFSAANEMLGTEYMRKLAKQEPRIVQDQRLQVEWIARGKYPILIAATEQAEAEFVKAGAPIELLDLAEGGNVSQSSGALSLALKAPHPNAAKVVINWVLSKEGQTKLAKAYLMQSGRVDVPTDFLPPNTVRKPGRRYINNSTEEFQFLKTENLKLAEKIFGHLK